MYQWLSDDLSCGTGVNCQEHEEKTWLKHKNVNSFSNDLTIIDYVHYVYSFFSQFFGQDTIIIYYPGKIYRRNKFVKWKNFFPKIV